MPKIKDLARIDQPREMLEKYGPGKLSDAQLLAILLRTGTRDCNVVELSKKILKKFPGEKLLGATSEDLSEIHGLGKVKASEIIACLEFGKRILKGKKSTLILSPKDVWESCQDIRDHKKEHFVVFFLDTRNQQIQREIISVGTLNANLVHPREVFEPAIKHSAAQIIVCHNHPSGNPQPSDEDIAITKRLQEAGKILGIEITDHVVVCQSSFLSLKCEGLC
ncbi:MAG: DNA repair protein RadC [Candidatus Moranbacteria bacterium]|nr:DNA repair protein RadC [Candidatus Moranbacteria bacterium]